MTSRILFAIAVFVATVLLALALQFVQDQRRICSDCGAVRKSLSDPIDRCFNCGTPYVPTSGRRGR